MDWYRRYHGTCADPKMRLVARSAAVPTPFAIAAWDAVLEHASAHDDRGSAGGLSPDLLAVTIDCSEDEASRLLEAFRKRGMIAAGDRLAAWDRRQPKDATAADRMKRYRDRKRAAETGEPDDPGETDTALQRNEKRNERNVTPIKRNGLPQSRAEQNREEQNRKEEAAEPPAAATAYRWEGHVVRLNERDYSRWAQMAPDVDLDAYLMGRDAYLSEAKDRQKRWFVTTSTDLGNRQQAVTQERRDKARRKRDEPKSGFGCGIIFGMD